MQIQIRLFILMKIQIHHFDADPKPTTGIYFDADPDLTTVFILMQIQNRLFPLVRSRLLKDDQYLYQTHANFQH
jgi:hypothetical protein